MNSNKKFVTILELLVITFLVMSVVPVCGLSDSSADISAYPDIVNPGDEIPVTYSGAPGFELDWIAMFKAGEQDIYEYGLGKVLYFLDGKKSGTLTFTAPDEPGDYDFRLFETGVGTDIARSNIVTVQEGTTQTSEEAIILFEENFDDGYAWGFGNEVGDWEVHLLYSMMAMPGGLAMKLEIGRYIYYTRTLASIPLRQEPLDFLWLAILTGKITS
jgi:hypothetical protein